MNALIYCLRHCVDFSGRDSRRVFWTFIALSQTIGILLLIPWLISFFECWWEMTHDPVLLDIMTAMLTDMSSAEHIFYSEYLPQAQNFISSYYADLPFSHPFAFWTSLLAVFWFLAFFIPTLATGVRRLRDAGHSPWWILPPVVACLPIPLVSFIAFILSFVTLVFWCQKSIAGREQNDT